MTISEQVMSGLSQMALEGDEFDMAVLIVIDREDGTARMLTHYASRDGRHPELLELNGLALAAMSGMCAGLRDGSLAATSLLHDGREKLN